MTKYITNKGGKQECDYCGSTENVEYVEYEDSMGMVSVDVCQKCQQKGQKRNLASVLEGSLKRQIGGLYDGL